MASLATIADLTARGIVVDPSETAIVQEYLDEASAIVRDAAGCLISKTTGTIKLQGDTDRWLRLPGPPVESVSAVTIDDVAVTDFKVRGDSLWRECGWQRVGWHCSLIPSEIAVTYTHGYDPVPDDIIGLVCRLAAQALVAYRNAGGDGATAIGTRPAQSERIGDYSITYSGGSTNEAAGTGTMALNDWQREKLAARFGASVAAVRLR